MTTNDAYLYYEAGQAVAAAHLGLTIRSISGEAVRASEIVLPREDPRAGIILLLTGMAAERKGVGQSDPLRRTRNRARLRRTVENAIAGMSGSAAARMKEGRRMVSQAQDQANNLCAILFEAMEAVVKGLRKTGTLSGDEVVAIVAAAKGKRRLKSKKSQAAKGAKKGGRGSDNQRKSRGK